MNAEIVAAVVAGAIAISLEVIPGLREIWEGVGKRWKPAVMLGLSLAVPLMGIGFKCLGVDVGLGASCPDPASPQLWVDALVLGLIAFLSSQLTFQTVGRPLGDRLQAAEPA